jgi:hypothetical protein
VVTQRTANPTTVLKFATVLMFFARISSVTSAAKFHAFRIGLPFSRLSPSLESCAFSHHFPPMTDDTWKRKYRWVLTVPGQDEEDWSAFHDGLCIGRVSRDRTSLKRGMFIWSGNCSD